MKTSQIRQIKIRQITLFNGDRMMMGSSLVLGVMLIVFGKSLTALIMGGVVLATALIVLPMAHKADPYMLKVYLRHIAYSRYYAPRQSVFKSSEFELFGIFKSGLLAKRFKGWK